MYINKYLLINYLIITDFSPFFLCWRLWTWRGACTGRRWLGGWAAAAWTGQWSVWGWLRGRDSATRGRSWGRWGPHRPSLRRGWSWGVLRARLLPAISAGRRQAARNYCLVSQLSCQRRPCTSISGVFLHLPWWLEAKHVCTQVLCRVLGFLLGLSVSGASVKLSMSKEK